MKNGKNYSALFVSPAFVCVSVFIAAIYIHCDSMSELGRNKTVLSAPKSRVAL